MILGDWRLKLSHTPRSKEVSAIGLPRWSNGQDSMLPNTVAQGLIPGQRAAAAAKLRQSCLTLCDRIDSSPTGSSVPGILQARILEWVAISFSNAWKWKVKVKLLSRIRFLATPWTVAYQAPPSMGFSRQEYWVGLPLPSPVRELDSAYCKPHMKQWRPSLAK